MLLCIGKMFTRGSPKILALSKGAQKKVSPKASSSKKCRGKDLDFILWKLLHYCFYVSSLYD
jgi:hypothetical protein